MFLPYGYSIVTGSNTRKPVAKFPKGLREKPLGHECTVMKTNKFLVFIRVDACSFVANILPAARFGINGSERWCVFLPAGGWLAPDNDSPSPSAWSTPVPPCFPWENAR